jgi:protease-4
METNNKLKKYLKKSGIIVGFIASFVFLSFISYAIYDSVMYGDSYENSEYASDSEDYSECTVLGINLHGTLLTYVPEGNDEDFLSDSDVTGSEDIVSAIWAAEEDENIKGVLLEIDSYGGMPVAGEEIADALKNLSKPSVAVIRQSGTSAAYWAAIGADRIFASKNSDVGSIGVTMSYLEEATPDKKYIQLSSGKFKDAGDPDKPLTNEEKEILLRDIKIIHENFIDVVAAARNIPKDQVRVIADGSSVLGDRALSLKLIDEIGSWKDAERYLEQQIGEKPEICW